MPERQTGPADPEAPMRLLVQELPDGDLARLAAFLRIGSGHRRGRWQLVFEGEVDLLLVGGAEPCTVRGMLEAPAAVVRVLDAPPADMAEQVLLRPIEYDALMALLDESARRRGGAAAEPAPAALLPDVPAEPAALLPPRARVRLRRWPPLWLLGDMHGRRLAAFMSVRPIDLAELAALSKVPAQRCRDFVAELHAAHLLEVELPAAPARAAAATTAAAAAARGLLGRIRRSLGPGASAAYWFSGATKR